MNTNDIKDIYKETKSNQLSRNEDYYNNVFKKTERIVSASYYVLSFMEPNRASSVHYDSLIKATASLHDAALASLCIRQSRASDELGDLQYQLLALLSHYTTAVSGRVIADTVHQSLHNEIDTVMRYINNHFINDTPNPSPALATAAPARPSHHEPRKRRVRATIPANDLSSDAVLVYSDLNDRATRIKTVLEAKPQATIKDLTEIITDVSSKTIQRELNSLIEKAEVKREGERRWSTYSLIK